MTSRYGSLAAVCGVALLAACGGHDDTVVVYTSVDEVFARPIANGFEHETGIRVLLVPDTEEAKSTGLLNRLIAEQDRPQCDVFWSGDPVRAAVLKARGIAAPWQPSGASGLPARFSDPEGCWTGFSARARVLLYNRDRVSADQAPRSVLDLADARYAGAACLANPLFGTTSMHAAALFEVLGEERAQRFFADFARQGGKIVVSNGEVRRRVASGECAVGLCDSDDAHVAVLEGKPVEIVYPDAEGMGVLLVPDCAVLIAGAPHERNAKRFIDWLLRPETETALAASEAAQIPLRPGVPAPAGVPRLEDLTVMPVDYGRLATRLTQLESGFLATWVEANR